MKAFKRMLALVCAGTIVAGLGAFAGCTDEPNPGPGPGPIDPDGPGIVEEVSISLNKTTATVNVGETVEITATVANSTEAISATSSNTEVATVAVSGNKVTVTTLKDGNATITVSVGGKNATCAITVEALPSAALLDVSYVLLEDDYVENDDTSDISTMELPVTYNGSGTISCSVEDDTIVTASYANGKVTLTANGTGKTVLTVTDGTDEAECTVEVATFGLVYGNIESGDATVMEVSDSERRTSENVYIPGYYWFEDDEAYYPVTQIKGGIKNASGGWDGNGGFTDATNLKTIYLGDNLVTIGANAFRRCTSIVEAVCGPNLKVVDGYAFDGATAFKTFDATNATQLKTITRCAFSACGLEEITLPASVDFIGDSGFSGCGSLKVVKILGPITSIYGSTFQKCNELTELWLPAELKNIESLAFYMSDESWSEFDITWATTVHFAGTREEWNALKSNAASNSANTFFNDHNKNLTVYCADDE